MEKQSDLLEILRDVVTEFEQKKYITAMRMLHKAVSCLCDMVYETKKSKMCIHPHTESLFCVSCGVAVLQIPIKREATQFELNFESKVA